MKTLPEMLAGVTEKNPRRTAIVEGDRTLTYAELQESVLSVAGQL